jgi:hypothetical protein
MDGPQHATSETHTFRNTRQAKIWWVGSQSVQQKLLSYFRTLTSMSLPRTWLRKECKKSISNDVIQIFRKEKLSRQGNNIPFFPLRIAITQDPLNTSISDGSPKQQKPNPFPRIMLAVDCLKFFVLKDSDYKGNITNTRSRFVAMIFEDKKQGGEKVTSDRLHVKQRTRDLSHCLYLACYYVPCISIKHPDVLFKDTSKKT